MPAFKRQLLTAAASALLFGSAVMASHAVTASPLDNTAQLYAQAGGAGGGAGAGGAGAGGAGGAGAGGAAGAAGGGNGQGANSSDGSGSNSPGSQTSPNERANSMGVPVNCASIADSVARAECLANRDTQSK